MLYLLATFDYGPHFPSAQWETESLKAYGGYPQKSFVVTVVCWVRSFFLEDVSSHLVSLSQEMGICFALSAV